MFEIDETGPWHRLPTELISDIVMMARPKNPVAEMVKVFYDDVYADILHLAARAANEEELRMSGGRLTIDEAWIEHHDALKTRHLEWVAHLDTHDARIRIARDYWFWHNLNEQYGHLGIVGEFVDESGALDGDDVFLYFTGHNELIEEDIEPLADFGENWDFPPTDVTAALVASMFGAS